MEYMMLALEYVAGNAGPLIVVIIPICVIWTKLTTIESKLTTICQKQTQHWEWHINQTSKKEA